MMRHFGRGMCKASHEAGIERLKPGQAHLLMQYLGKIRVLWEPVPVLKPVAGTSFEC